MKHFDPRWDRETGLEMLVDGKSYPIYECREDPSSPNNKRIPPGAMHWHGTLLQYTEGNIGGLHDIVYLAPRTYIRVPRA